MRASESLEVNRVIIWRIRAQATAMGSDIHKESRLSVKASCAHNGSNRGLQRQPGNDAALIAALDRAKTAIEQVEPGVRFERTEVVVPKISCELARTGIIAVVLASLAMPVYVWIRFEWPRAVGAISSARARVCEPNTPPAGRGASMSRVHKSMPIPPPNRMARRLI